MKKAQKEAEDEEKFLKNARAKSEGDYKMSEKRIIDMSTDWSMLKECKRKLAKRVYFLKWKVK